MKNSGKYAASLAVLLGAGLVLGVSTLAQAKEVSGKVVAVYHEPVTVNNKTMDKVSATVLSCQTGQYETVSYNPGSVSDDNSLGFLFNDLATSARAMVQKNQYMSSVSGHATFVTNDQNVVQKSTFWGYNWECGKDIDRMGASAGAQMMGAPSGAPAAAPASPGAPANPLGKLRKFGAF